MPREIVRTMPLSAPLRVGDGEINELEFLEPGSELWDRIEQVTEHNKNARKLDDVIPISREILVHLTGKKAVTLSNLSFDDRKRANEIAMEIMGAKLDPGEA